MKPVCMRCGTPMDYLTNGYICPKCSLSIIKPVMSPQNESIRTYTDKAGKIVWTREELVELIKEVIREEENDD